MPLNPNRTKNGVDLNDVDVSQLALVDKQGLIDELIQKVQTVVNTSDSDDSGPSGPSNSYSARPRNANRPSGSGSDEKALKDRQAEFEAIHKLKDRAYKAAEKALAVQARQNRNARKDAQKGKVYSNAGLSHAESLDELADGYTSLSHKELADVKLKLADLKKGIQFKTSGDESKLLTSQAIALEKALELESKTRKTLLGKIQHAFTSNAVDIVSIVSGISSGSPMVAHATQYVLNTIRDAKDEKQNKKVNNLKNNARQLKDSLPQQVDDTDTHKKTDSKMESEVLDRFLSGMSDPDARYATLEQLRKSDSISDEQHVEMKGKHFAPDFTPYGSNSPIGVPAKPAATAPTPKATKITPVHIEPSDGSTVAAPPTVAPVLEPLFPPVETLASPQPVVSNSPEKMPYQSNGFDWQEHLKKPKKQQDDEEKLAWVDLYKKSLDDSAIAQHKHRLANPLVEGSDAYKFHTDKDLFGENALEDYYAPPKLRHPELRTPEKVDNPNNPVMQMAPPEPVKSESSPEKVQESIVALARTVERVIEPLAMSPERLDARSVAVDSEGVNPESQPALEATLQQRTDILHDDMSRVEKLNAQQLEELLKMNKSLQRQVEQADLAADAKLRDAANPQGHFIDALKPKEDPAAGGLGKGLLGIIGALSKPGATIGKLLGGTRIGRTFSAIKGGIGGLLGGGKNAASVVGGVAEGAEGAAVAGKTGGLLSKLKSPLASIMKMFTSVTEGVGFISKIGNVIKSIGGGLLGKLSKFAGFGKLLGKLAWPIQVILAIFDFVSGFANAEKYLGDVDLTTWDRISGGLGAVVQGIVGLVDFITGLFGLKTELGPFFGKLTAKVFSGRIVSDIVKGIFSLFDGIKEFAGNGIKLGQKLVADSYKSFTDFSVKVVDFIASLGKNVGSLLGFDALATVYNDTKKVISDVITNVGEYVRGLIGPTAFDGIKSVVTAIVDGVTSPFTALLDLVTGKFNIVTNLTNKIKSAIGMKVDENKPVAPKPPSPPKPPTAPKPSPLSDAPVRVQPTAAPPVQAQPAQTAPVQVASPVAPPSESPAQAPAAPPTPEKGNLGRAASAVGSGAVRVGQAVGHAAGAVGNAVASTAGKLTHRNFSMGKNYSNVKFSNIGELGSISSMFESGSKGPAAIGWDSTGGYSYGSYQIAARSGTLAKYMAYLKTNYPEIAQRLESAGGATAGGSGNPKAPTPENAKFQEAWKSLASDPQFQESQHAFIKSSHYTPAMKSLQSAGIDLSNRSKTVQDALWSASVQFGAGGGTNLIRTALGVRGKTPAETAKIIGSMSDTAILKAIYAERDNTGKWFASSTKEVQESVKANRGSQGEGKVALAQLEYEQSLGNSPRPESKPTSTTSLQQMAKAVDGGTSPQSVASPAVKKEPVTASSFMKPTAQSVPPPVQKSQMQAPAPQAGFNAAKKSTENKLMVQSASMDSRKGATVIAPSTNSVVNNNQTNVTPLKAKNNESTYQRLMNSMYSPS